MKFITPLCALIATTAVYASSDGTWDAYRQCQKDLLNYKECLNEPTPNSLDIACPKYQSERCQQFYNDPFKYVPICEKDIVNQHHLHPILMNYMVQGFQLACQKDEAGNSCPFSGPVIRELMNYNNEINYQLSEEEIKKAKEDTCKSKLCREATYNSFVYIRIAKNYYDEKIALGHISKETAALKEDIAAYLDSDECRAMGGDVKQESTAEIGKTNTSTDGKTNASTAGKTNNDGKQGKTSEEDKTTSDASTLKIINGTFITLGLLLLSLF